MINIESFFNGFLVIIGTSAQLTTINQTSHQLVLRNSKFNHCSNLMITLGQHFLQSLSLRNCTRETIEDYTFMVFSKSIINTGKDIYHQIIRNQLTVIDESLSGLT